MRDERGYSLVELLVVVAMIGIVALVTLPALMQLMPQYRIRGAASEAAAAMRMLRQRAITTRTPWRISFDVTNNRYRFWTLTSPYADMSVATNWRAIRRDGRTPDPTGEDWFMNPSIDLNAPTDTFNDVACPADGRLDLIFQRDGSIATNAPCSGPSTDVLTFSPNPGVVFAVDSSVVRFNRYYLSVSQTGLVEVRAAKE
jgi:prepilin-type N-terminal cleavage/methylation domain-containing protein